MGSKTNRRLPTGPSLTGMTTHANRTARLAMDARHHLERRDLYRSKAAGPHAVSSGRQHDLDRAYDHAVGQLEIAEAQASAEVDAELPAYAASRSATEPVRRARPHLRLIVADPKAEPSSPARPVATTGWDGPDLDIAVAVALPVPGWPTEY